MLSREPACGPIRPRRVRASEPARACRRARSTPRSPAGRPPRRPGRRHARRWFESVCEAVNGSTLTRTRLETTVGFSGLRVRTTDQAATSPPSAGSASATWSPSSSGAPGAVDRGASGSHAPERPSRTIRRTAWSCQPTTTPPGPPVASGGRLRKSGGPASTDGGSVRAEQRRQHARVGLRCRRLARLRERRAREPRHHGLAVRGQRELRRIGRRSERPRGAEATARRPERHAGLGRSAVAVAPGDGGASVGGAPRCRPGGRRPPSPRSAPPRSRVLAARPPPAGCVPAAQAATAVPSAPTAICGAKTLPPRRWSGRSPSLASSVQRRTPCVRRMPAIRTPTRSPPTASALCWTSMSRGDTVRGSRQPASAGPARASSAITAPATARRGPARARTSTIARSIRAV